MSWGEDNTKTFNDIEALLEKVEHGKLDVTLDVHNKRITRLSVFGQKRNKYQTTPEDQSQAPLDILRKIKSSMDAKEESQVTFVVKIHKNKIKEVFWHSTFEKIYE